jgi:hypothetical protein
VIANSTQSARLLGNLMPRIPINEKTIVQAMTNLMPAKVNGGRSARPSLIKSQVDPQMPQSTSQTRRAFIADGQLEPQITRTTQIKINQN